MQNFKKISIIIVNYKSQAKLRACVMSVLKQLKNADIEIIIVNNDVQENISEGLAGLPMIQTIDLGKNVGFGKAINHGAKKAHGEWLMFLNPDTRLLTNHEKLFSFFGKNKEAGIISARLVEENGDTQKWSAGVEPSLLDLVGNNIGLARSKKLWKSKKTKEVDWVSGAAMIVKKQLFDKINGFDENIFMYYEDIDLCKRARKTGKKVFYFPEERVLHFGGESVESKTKQKTDYYKSQDYYFQKYYGKGRSKCVRLLRNIFLKHDV